MIITKTITTYHNISITERLFCINDKNRFVFVGHPPELWFFRPKVAHRYRSSYVDRRRSPRVSPSVPAGRRSRGPLRRRRQTLGPNRARRHTRYEHVPSAVISTAISFSRRNACSAGRRTATVVTRDAIRVRDEYARPADGGEERPGGQ